MTEPLNPARPVRVKNDVDGILLVDKPSDWTSFDVLNMMKHRFSVRKIGHCGTLDPMATGLLVVLLGKATKLQDSLMGGEKEYLGSLRLGMETDTEDSTGNVTATADWSGVTLERAQEVARSFLGEIEQIPPMMSAIKLHGKPLYKLARKGVTVERKARPVTIRAFDFTEVALPEISFRVQCSKGTYIRTLCADFGHRLGCGACMTALRRTRSGEFSLADALPVETLQNADLEELREFCRKKWTE